MVWREREVNVEVGGGCEVAQQEIPCCNLRHATGIMADGQLGTFTLLRADFSQPRS